MESDDDSFEEFEAKHIAQLSASGVPNHLWRKLHWKLMNEVYDAGDYFQILAETNEDGRQNYSVVTIKDVLSDDPDSIFLIDHAWTFQPQYAREQLEQNPQLLDRLCDVFGIEAVSKTRNDSDYCGSDDETIIRKESTNILKEGIQSQNADGDKLEEPKNDEADSDVESAVETRSYLSDDNDDERRIEKVLSVMWRYTQTYTVRVVDKTLDESDMPVWYITDEFGLSIGHNDKPNCRMVPLYFIDRHMAYSLLFPVDDIMTNGLVTRNYIDTVVHKKNPGWRDVLLYPWHPIDLSQQPIEHVYAMDNFLLSGRTLDTIPDYTKFTSIRRPLKQAVLRVFCDEFQIIDCLKTVNVEIVDSIEKADVIWLRSQFHDYKNLFEKNPNALINQFPFESLLTVKDLLAASIQLANREKSIDGNILQWPPKWFQTTFNLELELPQFVTYYQQAARRDLDNTWIIKPWNLSRGLDLHVTDDLSCIIRLVETGPKIACKYIHRPLLFRRPDNGNLVKFDLRYIVFVNSLKPLKAYVYKNFWIRFAINEFSLWKLDDRETHFTVFNYSNEDKILNMECADFISELEKQYPSLSWKDIQEEINRVIKEALEIVSSGEPPRTVSPNPQSRAMYGMDLMLKWDSDDVIWRSLEVSFIEANFIPDCKRACLFYDDFADTVFKTLFLDEIDEEKLHVL